MELYHSVKNPINQNNPFGADPEYYKNLGQAGHPGIDYEAPSGTPLYAPCDGDAFYTYDKYGGDGIYIRYPNNQNPTHNIILWHLFPKGDAQHPFKINTENFAITKVKAGQLLGYTDNSGHNVDPKKSESTGPHLHMGVQPIDSGGKILHPDNGFLGCIDPKPFLNGKFAQDIETLTSIVDTTSLIAEEIQNAPVSKKDKFDLYELLKKVAEGFLTYLQK